MGPAAAWADPREHAMRPMQRRPGSPSAGRRLALCLAGLGFTAHALVRATDTDLDALLIERTPKYDYNAPKNRPQAGDEVIFHAHLRHWGGDTSLPQATVPYEWRVDGTVAGTGSLSAFEPLIPPFAMDYTGYPDPHSAVSLREPTVWPKNPLAYDPAHPPTGLRVVALPWTWQDGAHTVEFIVDPDNRIPEASEQNNRRAERTDAIAAGFWVEESTWRYFHQGQPLLGIGSNSWEDWIQRQMARQNALYAAAVWPDTPNGVSTRVRIDRLIVVPDGLLPVNGGLPSNNPDSSDRTVDLQWGFSHGLLDGGFYADHTTVSDSNPFCIEPSLLHELGHARYLIDCYGFDVHNTASHHAVQVWEGSTYVAGSAYLPFLAFGEVLYYNRSGGVMTGPYGFQWSPYEARALELLGNGRATCGNMNSPCNIGTYLQDLPANNHLRCVDALGGPRAGVDVRVFQAADGPDWYGKTIDNTADQFYTADADGVVHLPRNPFNPGGNITHTYGRADGVMLLRFQQDDQVWYRLMEVSDFNLAYWRGLTQDAYYEVALDGPNPALPEGAFTAVYPPDSSRTGRALYDLTGHYQASLGGLTFTTDLRQDPKGALAGEGRLGGALPGGGLVDLPIALRGKCAGTPDSTTARLRLASTGAKAGLGAKGTMELSVADGRLVGTLTASVSDGQGGKETVQGPLGLDLPLGMDGTHRITLNLVLDTKGKVSGTGALVLANGRSLPLTAKGTGTRGQADLALAGDRAADPSASGSKLAVGITTSAGGVAEMRWAKGKAYGQTLAWP